jgi:hypothetical protein
MKPGQIVFHPAFGYCIVVKPVTRDGKQNYQVKWPAVGASHAFWSEVDADTLKPTSFNPVK